MVLLSPQIRTNPGFVGKGRTLGELENLLYQINKIPKDAIIKIVKIMIYSNETEFAGSWLLENGNVKR